MAARSVPEMLFSSLATVVYPFADDLRDARGIVTCDVSRRSDLLLFDALDIEKGPIATIHVPIRLRFGLHGNFARSEEIGLAREAEAA